MKPEDQHSADESDSSTVPVSAPGVQGCDREGLAGADGNPFGRPPMDSSKASWIVLFVLTVLFVLLCAGTMGIESLASLSYLLGAIAAVGGTVAGVAVWTLRPMDRAAKEIAAPLQFTIGDFLCLFFLVQLPMALIHGLLQGEDQGARWILDISAWVIVGLFWSLGVHSLSRARIRNPRHRAMFLVFVGPSAILGVLILPALNGALLVAMYAAANGEMSWTEDGRRVALGAIVYLVLLVCICISGRLTRRMIAAAKIAETSQPGPEEALEVIERLSSNPTTIATQTAQPEVP